MAYSSLLSTKFYVPPVRPTLISRPRLLERLAHGLGGPLTLISAPAGYGKTTLFSEWCTGPGASIQLAWLSLDVEDNDPLRFFQYLLTCLDAIQPGALQDILPLLQSPEPPHYETILTLLANALTDHKAGLCAGPRRLPCHRGECHPRRADLPAQSPAFPHAPGHPFPHRSAAAARSPAGPQPHS